MLSETFMTVKDIAELLKVGEVTVRHWIRDGDLRAIDVGREWRIAPVDLEDFLERHETVGRQSRGDRRSGRGSETSTGQIEGRAPRPSAGKN